MPKGSSPFSDRPKSRSPFPRPALPQAGQSLYEQAMSLLHERFLFYVTVALTLIMVAAIEWMGIGLKQPISPWFWTVFAAIMTALSIWRWFRIWPQIRTMGIGVRGEREVGRMLEQLRAKGYVVFHDIPGNGFNVDHALIGPGGVFAIETKTRTKPADRKAVVDYDGTRVLVDGKEMDRDPVAQAEAGADHVRDILKRMTSREVNVRPVVLFPGWWVNPQPRDCRTWVLNEKVLSTFLANEPQTLSREDIALYSDRLTLHLSED